MSAVGFTTTDGVQIFQSVFLRRMCLEGTHLQRNVGRSALVKNPDFCSFPFFSGNTIRRARLTDGLFALSGIENPSGAKCCLR